MSIETSVRFVSSATAVSPMASGPKGSHVDLTIAQGPSETISRAELRMHHGLPVRIVRLSYRFEIDLRHANFNRLHVLGQNSITVHLETEVNSAMCATTAWEWLKSEVQNLPMIPKAIEKPLWHYLTALM
ncbi:MAG: hypothetical protein WDN48_07430 [Pseudolabrys sp.]